MIDRWGLLLHGSLWCPGAEFKSIIAVAASMSDSVKDKDTQRSEHCSVSVCVCLYGGKSMDWSFSVSTQPFRTFELFIPNQTEERVNSTAAILKGMEEERKRLMRTNNENSPA